MLTHDYLIQKELFDKKNHLSNHLRKFFSNTQNTRHTMQVNEQPKTQDEMINFMERTCLPAIEYGGSVCSRLLNRHSFTHILSSGVGVLAGGALLASNSEQWITKEVFVVGGFITTFFNSLLSPALPKHTIFPAIFTVVGQASFFNLIKVADNPRSLYGEPYYQAIAVSFIVQVVLKKFIFRVFPVEGNQSGHRSSFNPIGSVINASRPSSSGSGSGQEVVPYSESQSLIPKLNPDGEGYMLQSLGQTVVNAESEETREETLATTLVRRRFKMETADGGTFKREETSFWSPWRSLNDTKQTYTGGTFANETEESGDGPIIEEVNE